MDDETTVEDSGEDLFDLPAEFTSEAAPEPAPEPTPAPVAAPPAEAPPEVDWKGRYEEYQQKVKPQLDEYGQFNNWWNSGGSSEWDNYQQWKTAQQTEAEQAQQVDADDWFARLEAQEQRYQDLAQRLEQYEGKGQDPVIEKLKLQHTQNELKKSLDRALTGRPDIPQNDVLKTFIEANGALSIEQCAAFYTRAPAPAPPAEAAPKTQTLPPISGGATPAGTPPKPSGGDEFKYSGTLDDFDRIWDFESQRFQ